MGGGENALKSTQRSVKEGIRDSIARTNMPKPDAATLGMLFWGALLSFGYAIPWSSSFLLLSQLGIKLFVARDRETCSRIQQRVKWFSHTADSGKGYGYFIGKWFFGSANIFNEGNGAPHFDIWIITTDAKYAELSRDQREVTSPSDSGLLPAPLPQESPCDAQPAPKPPKDIQVYERTGSYGSVWFKSRRIRGEALKPLAYCTDQDAAVSGILKYYAQHRHAVALLHGPPGTGKTAVSFLVAERLNASYCNTLKPWQPGDSLGDLYCEARPSEEKPLVICFDEIDGPIFNMMDGKAPHLSKRTPTAIVDKEGWNRMLDDIDRGFFPYLILVMTTNVPPSAIRGKDEAYLRTGRVNVEIELKQKK